MGNPDSIGSSLDESTPKNVTLVQPPPDPFLFDRQDGRYQAALSPIILDITTGRGSLLVIYRIEIPALGYAHETLRTISEPTRDERIRLTKPNVTIDASSINRTTYDGTVIISAHTSSSATVVYRSNVTVRFRD